MVNLTENNVLLKNQLFFLKRWRCINVEYNLQCSCWAQLTRKGCRRDPNKRSSKNPDQNFPIVFSKIDILVEVNQQKSVDRYNVDHKILSGNKLDQHKSVKLAKFLRMNVVSRYYDMEMIKTVRNVEHAITDGHIHHKTLTFWPCKKGLFSPLLKREDQNEGRAYQAQKNAHKSRYVNDQKLTIIHSIDW